LLAATALAAGATGARAEETGGPAGAGESEIIITARKRSEDIAKTPVIASAVSAEAIRNLGLTNISEFSRVVPQLVIGESVSVSGGAISLWGITSGEANQFNDQAVLFSIDGTQISRPAVQRMALMDLAQVAVYKGPQVLYFGKNSYAGVIDIHTADPTPDFRVGASARYEFEGDEIQGQAYFSGPITETLGARLAIYGAKIRGYLTNVAPADPLIGPNDRSLPDNRELAGRLTLVFTPNDSLNVRMKFGIQDMKGDGTTQGQQLTYCPYGVSQVGGAIDGQGAPCVADKKLTRSNLGPNFHALDPVYGDDPWAKLRQMVGSLTVNYEAGLLDLTSVSSFYDSNSKFMDNLNNSTAPAFIAANYQALDVFEFTQELRATTKLKGPINFTVGAYYQHSDLNRRFKFARNAVAPVSLIDDEAWQKGNAMSVFGQAIWNISDQIELAAGGRYSDEEKTFRAAIRGAPVQTMVPAGDWTNFSPEATLTWKPATTVTLFGSYKQGFLSGGFNAGSGDLRTDRSYDEQLIKGGEIGAKLRLFDRTVALDVSGYHYKLTGLQVLTQVGLEQFVENAGKATVEGIDATLNWTTPIDGLSLDGNVGYNHARYDTFITSCYAGQTIAMGCNLQPNLNGVFTAQNIAGMPLQRAPDWNLSGGFSYDIALSERYSLKLTGRGSYMSKYYADPSNNPHSLQDGYWLVDAGINLRDNAHGWSLAFIGKNLTDQLYYARTRDNLLTGGGAGTNNGRLADIAGILSRGRELWLQLSFDM
jgi:iron complex outermembrane receptor protein